MVASSYAADLHKTEAKRKIFRELQRIWVWLVSKILQKMANIFATQDDEKTVAVFQRLHKIQQYHRTLIYDLKDPRNFGEERNPQEKRNNWFSQAWYVDNHRDPTSGNEDDQENVGELILAESEISENETL